jgi:hypothetical protein
MKDPADMSKVEHQHWERQHEEAVAARDAKGLHGLRVLAALREHPGVDSFGNRSDGQMGQG